MTTCTHCKMNWRGVHEQKCPLYKPPGVNLYYNPMGWTCQCGKRNAPDIVICHCDLAVILGNK